MALPESSPEQAPRIPALSMEIQPLRPEVARILGFVKGAYDYKRYLPPDVDDGLSLSTALAAMHAIDAKGQKDGWNDTDLLAALSVTRVALTTAGFANAKEGLRALLTGATGELSDIMGKILPPDAPKGVTGVAKTIVRVNTVDNMRIVAGLLIDEKKLESRFLRLIRLQEDILLDPARTRALLGVLNGKYGSRSVTGSGLPQKAITPLTRISPFSLEDMIVVNKSFNAIENSKNSEIQIKAHRLQIETKLKRLDAAGINIAKIVSLGAESLTKNTLLILAGPIGGTLHGLIVGSDKVVGDVEKAIDTVKHNVAERKAAKARIPQIYETSFR